MLLWLRRITIVGLALAVLPGSARASDQIYFPADTNVTNVLVQLINAETVRVDIASWYLSEGLVSIAIANRWNAGVPVRIIGDRGSIFEADPHTKAQFYWLANQGVPIRLRYNPTYYPEIMHWKAAILAGQNKVLFGSGNFAPTELAPVSSTNYDDESEMVTDDPALVGAFKTKFDRMWNDTTQEPSFCCAPPYLKNWNDACALESACSDYRTQYPNPRPMVINTARLEPDNPLPPDMIWGQGPLFNSRLVGEINAETARVDLVEYRLTVPDITQALLSKWQSGVPVRIIIDTFQYANRLWPEYWLTHAYVDQLYAAGIPIRQRVHDGVTHMKTLITSAYATNASSNFAATWQRDHNYFVSAAAKPGIYQALRNRFQIMWNDNMGFAAFAPQPPDAATLASPASGASVGTVPTLVWNRAPFAASFDIYIGTSASNLALAGNVAAILSNDPPATYSWKPSTALAGGTTYFWKIVSRTFATPVSPSMVASSPAWTFSTGPRRTPSDFDGDGRADLSLFRPSSGTWWMNGIGVVTIGAAGDIPVPGDYNGDGRTDAAVFRPSTGTWYINGRAPVPFGAPGDIPVPADYDGDGKTDIAVFRPSTGMWFVLGQPGVQFGEAGDVPVPGDYGGTGRAQIAVFRRGIWISLGQGPIQWGDGGDIPVPADYNGDGRTDIAVYRPASGVWYVMNQFAVQWGALGDVPAPQDLDGDGRAELVVYRSEGGAWFSRNMASGASAMQRFGQVGDVPVLAARLKPATAGDFDGDCRADLSVYRPSGGTWWTLQSATEYTGGNVQAWGGSTGDIAVPADYLGLHRVQAAVFRGGTWFVNASQPLVIRWGSAGDVPVPADYDGDGRADLAVFRNGRWFILFSSSGFTKSATFDWGQAGDVPLAGDFDGDGKADLAVFRAGVWFLLYSTSNYASGSSLPLGAAGDIPVAADYDGDGVTDLAVYRPSGGTWFIRRSSTGVVIAQQFGGEAGDVPVPGDFDGDGRTDIAIFRPTNSTWFVFGQRQVPFGALGDVPILRRP